MTTDSPDTGSDASIIERLTASVEAPEAAPEQEPVAQTEQPEPQEAAEEAPPEEQSASSEMAEVEGDDGETYQVPAKYKDAHLRHQDYTRKAMGAASIVQQAQDRMHYAEAREQFVGAILQDVTEHRALQVQREQFANVDWQNMDLGRMMQLRDQRDDIDRKISAKEQEIKTKAQHAQSMQSAHTQKQWAMAVEGAKARIGKFTPDEDTAMLKEASDMGFSEQELRTRFADPRILHLIHKAAKYESLQRSKPGALSAVNKAPPVLKPGASKGPGVAAEQKYRDQRALVKKTGDVRDVAKLFLMRGS